VEELAHAETGGAVAVKKRGNDMVKFATVRNQRS
jgi:hypothetical protein